MDGSTMLVIFFIVAAISALTIVSKQMNKNSGSSLTESEQNIEPELTARFHMGQYLGGLPEAKDKAPIVFCGVTKDTFVFRKGTQGVEIGRIPRNGIQNIKIAKTKKYHGITIQWANGHDTTYESLFEFEDKKSEALSAETVEKLKAWIVPKESVASSKT